MELPAVNQRTLENFKSNLVKDQLAFQRAYEDFIRLKPLITRKSDDRIDKLRKNKSDNIGIGRVYNTVGSEVKSWRKDSTRELMLTNEINRRNTIRDVVRSPTPPKYGLPGLGEYDERKNRLLRERKNDYVNYLNEQNAMSRRRPNFNDKLLDYEGLLDQKRREEYSYRQFVFDPYVNNHGGAMKPAKSDSNVDKVDNWNGLDFKENRLLDAYSSSNIDQPRPHSYPPEINMGLHSNSERNRDELGYKEPSNRSAANIHLFSYQTDSRSRRLLANDRWKSEKERTAEYQEELKMQIDEVHQRRAKMKEDDEKLNKKLEEENRNYDPWGREGGGAPRRDKYGKVIASRRQLDNFKIDEKANTEFKGSRRPSKTETEANYAIPRSPPTSRSPSDERSKLDRYKDDLQKQIEDKKLRDQLQKEAERLEEEKISRRIQEQQEKMQREYEEEQRKHRLREDERSRRNEALQKRHEEQKKETNRKRKELVEEERRKQWEAREKALGRHQTETEKTESESLPSVSSIKLKQEVDHSLESRRNSKEVQSLTTQKSTQPSASREHILSQLSAMRQQLEKEQEYIQEQLRKQKEKNYEIQNMPRQHTHREAMEPSSNSGFRKPLDGSNKEFANTQSKVAPDIYRPATVKLKDEDLLKEVSEEIVHHERRIAPQVRKILPTTSLSLRSLDGFVPLQGESLFLGVDGYDFAPRRYRKDQQNGKFFSTNDSPQSDIYDDDRLADLDAARKRYLNSVNDDPDEVNADSFLDEYLARNIRKRD